MNGPAGPFGVPEPVLAGEEPEVAPTQAGELSRTQCARCGAVGTHYLTCPGLRLPPGYRLGDAGAPGQH